MIRKNSDKTLSAYFFSEPLLLVIITITGLIYNVGLIFTPYLEGQLAQALLEVLNGNAMAGTVTALACTYIGIIIFVQGNRFLKRLFVRKFGNRILLKLKRSIYLGILAEDTRASSDEGSAMTKAVQDAEACAEGMRKFLTEVFDTGVVMVAYAVMLFLYDWRLTLLVSLFPPIAYFLAARLRVPVTGSARQLKEAAGILHANTLDRVRHAMLYRIYGVEDIQDQRYERGLADYERKATVSGILESAMQPLYQVVALAGVFFILFLGGKNVNGTGWCAWNVAAFTTFLSCYLKLCKKTSKSAKLFNSVQKALVSWKRIHPYLTAEDALPDEPTVISDCHHSLLLESVGIEIPVGDGNHKQLLHDISLHAESGQIIGITGPVACGKSLLTSAIMGWYPHTGIIQLDGQPLEKAMAESHVCYLGHDPELMNDTIRNNIVIGRSCMDDELSSILRLTCLDEDISRMKDGVDTVIGESGMQLSGGQQARVALARTLLKPRPVIILDDPFAALDRRTEAAIMEGLTGRYPNSILLLVSHRLEQFHKVDSVLYLDGNGAGCQQTHDSLLNTSPGYSHLYDIQNGEGEDHESA